MRLGQLARKLALRPADIADFLAQNNIRVADGANARLEKEEVSLIMKRFVPGWVDTSGADPEPGPESESVVDSTPDAPTEEPPAVVAETEVQQPAPPDTNEVIRAPKVELSGLKVVGKIELPSPKKKEETADDEGTPAGEPGVEQREHRRPFDKNRRKQQRPEKNPIALQREREAKAAQKKLDEQLARDKEKRTQKYLKNYKPSAPTKAARLIKEDVIAMTPEDLEEPPKTLFGKIIRWLTKAN